MFKTITPAPPAITLTVSNAKTKIYRTLVWKTLVVSQRFWACSGSWLQRLCRYVCITWNIQMKESVCDCSSPSDINILDILFIILFSFHLKFSLTYLFGNSKEKTFPVRARVCGINPGCSRGHRREKPLFGKSSWYENNILFVSHFWTVSSLFWIPMQRLRWHLSANLMIQRPSASTEHI